MKFMPKALYLFFLSALVLSCGGDGIEVDSEDHDDNEISTIGDGLDSLMSINTAIGGKMFSIPSPIQMVTMIRENVDTYNEKLLTDPENVANYTTKYKRAINMGVYGADLGYATIYENNTQAVSYLSSIEKLSDELGIAGAFDQDLLERFIDNGNNQDSMLVIMAEGYREGDKFLKDNEEHDVATLILTGGWIEGMYFAAVSFEESGSQEVANRIGEQKTGLQTIIDLLEDYNSDEFYTSLIADLKGLKEDFDKIEFNYTYVDPIHDVANKQTTIKSKSSVIIDDSVLKSIIAKVKTIRNGLIG